MSDPMDTPAVGGPPLAGAFQLPDGTWIRGRGLRHPLPSGPRPDFGLYLGSDKLRRHHESELPWPRAWIQWPDFLLPRDRDAAVQQIRALYERARAGAAVEVACGGGIGRTGTVVACLAILARPRPGRRRRLDTRAPPPSGRRNPLAAPLGAALPAVAPLGITRPGR
ncbi:protein-tyrosine phosphatase family protein [Nonomuraea ferruginea]